MYQFLIYLLIMNLPSVQGYKVNLNDVRTRSCVSVRFVGCDYRSVEIEVLRAIYRSVYL